MTVEQSIEVHHNAEVAHRLSLQPGKCQKIHGHSLMIHLTIWGNVDEQGFLEGLDFSVVKGMFRAHIDNTYDHRLLMNMEDPWAMMLRPVSLQEFKDYDENSRTLAPTGADMLPGLVTFPGDPTIENIARWVGEWAEKTFGLNNGIHVRVDETKTNGATWSKRT